MKLLICSFWLYIALLSFSIVIYPSFVNLMKDELLNNIYIIEQNSFLFYRNSKDVNQLFSQQEYNIFLTFTVGSLNVFSERFSVSCAATDIRSSLCSSEHTFTVSPTLFEKEYIKQENSFTIIWAKQTMEYKICILICTAHSFN